MARVLLHPSLPGAAFSLRVLLLRVGIVESGCLSKGQEHESADVHVLTSPELFQSCLVGLGCNYCRGADEPSAGALGEAGAWAGEGGGVPAGLELHVLPGLGGWCWLPPARCGRISDSIPQSLLGLGAGAGCSKSQLPA